MTAVAELPPVSGPHRNRALAAARHARAVELATAGLTYEQIAAELGYANRGTVHRIVAQALRRETVSAVEELRRLELDRLDALQFSLWEAASNGDVEAAKTVVRIIESRCRLLGLASPGRSGPDRKSGRGSLQLASVVRNASGGSGLRESAAAGSISGVPDCERQIRNVRRVV